MQMIKDPTDLFRRRNAYRAVFSSPEGQVVLRDLAEVCHAASTTFDSDPRLHALAEGKRLIWLRIQQYMRMTDDEIDQLIKGERYG